LGLLGLKQSVVALPLMIPLIVGTALFSWYVNQQHFRVCLYLTPADCFDTDVKHTGTVDFATWERDYIQPELRTKIVLPDLSEGQELPLDLRDEEASETASHKKKSQSAVNEMDDRLTI
jgi:hypothetical protein